MSAPTSRKPGRVVPRVLLVLASPLAMLLCGQFFAGCSVGDQFCVPGADPAEKEDACPYGPPGGPERPRLQQTCATINAARTVDLTLCGPTTTWDLLYTNVIDNGMTGKCTDASCHGGVAQGGGLNIPSGNAKAAFDQLSAYSNTQRGGAYINADPANKDARLASWFPCNLDGIAEGGSPMPKPNGLDPDADASAAGFDDVELWFMCWAENPTQYGPGGMGMGTGTTTGGGAGGAGGAAGM